jgi:hypothetical protein
VSRGTGASSKGVRVQWLARQAFLELQPDLPTAGPGQPGVYVQLDEWDDLTDPQSYRESGGRVCRRCGNGVPLMTAESDELCPCGGRLL